MSSIPREALNTSASKPGEIVVPSSTLSVSARAISSCGSEISAGVILLRTSAAAYPSIRSAPTLNSWVRPLSGGAMLEKLALWRMAFCSAPVLRSASCRRTSAPASAVVVSSVLVAAATRLLGEHGRPGGRMSVLVCTRYGSLQTTACSGTSCEKTALGGSFRNELIGRYGIWINRLPGSAAALRARLRARREQGASRSDPAEDVIRRRLRVTGGARPPLGIREPAGLVVPVEVLVAPPARALVALRVLDHHVEEPALALEQQPRPPSLALLREHGFVDHDCAVGERPGAISGDGLVVRVVVMESAAVGERGVGRADDQRLHDHPRSEYFGVWNRRLGCRRARDRRRARGQARRRYPRPSDVWHCQTRPSREDSSRRRARSGWAPMSTR